MGLIPMLLAKVPRVGNKCAVGFLVGKLIWRCVKTGRRPLRILEKVGFFVLDRKNGRLGFTYVALRMAVHRQITATKVDTALAYCEPGARPDDLTMLGVMPEDVYVTLKLLEEVEDLRSYSGFKFAEFMMNQRAVDSRISGRYGMARGRFNLHHCLSDYYSSPRMQDFHDMVCQGKAAGHIDKEHLQASGDKVWKGILCQTQNDVIDFLIL